MVKKRETDNVGKREVTKKMKFGEDKKETGPGVYVAGLDWRKVKCGCRRGGLAIWLRWSPSSL